MNLPLLLWVSCGPNLWGFFFVFITVSSVNGFSWHHYMPTDTNKQTLVIIVLLFYL